MTQRKQSETTTCSGYLSEVDTHLDENDLHHRLLANRLSTS